MREMGQLLCACNIAGYVNCSFCKFSSEHNPVKMFVIKTWVPKDVSVLQLNQSNNGLDQLALEIINGLDHKDMIDLGLTGPVHKLEGDE